MQATLDHPTISTQPTPPVVTDEESLFLLESYKYDSIPMQDGVYFIGDREYHIQDGQVAQEFNVLVDDAQLSFLY